MSARDVGEPIRGNLRLRLKNDGKERRQKGTLKSIKNEHAFAIKVDAGVTSKVVRREPSVQGDGKRCGVQGTVDEEK